MAHFALRRAVLLALLVPALVACRAPAAPATPTAAPTLQPTPTYPEGNTLIPMRGVPAVADPGPKPSWFKGARYLGANYVQVVHFPEIDVDTGEIAPDVRTTEASVRRIIEQAHAQGLHVFLQLYPEYYSRNYWEKYHSLGPYLGHGGGTDPAAGVTWEGELAHGPVQDQVTFMRAYTDLAVQWARIAEELHVELYSPACELNVFVSWQNNARWHQEALPLLRQAYHGDLVAKGEINWLKYNLTPVGDLSFWDYYAGWDYVGADVFGDTVSPAQYPQYVSQLLANTQSLKAKFGAKGIIFCEIGVPNTSNAWNDPRLSNDEICLRYWDTLLQLATGKVDGMFFWAWDASSLEQATPEKGPTSPREWQGPGALLRVYFCAVPEQQRRAFEAIHQFLWTWSDQAKAGGDTEALKSKLDAGTQAFAAGRYDAALSAAEEGLTLAKETLPAAQAQALIVETQASLQWLESVGWASLVDQNAIEQDLAQASQTLEQGAPAAALELARQAHGLAGTKVDDPQGDALGENLGDLKTVYLQTDGLTATALVEVFGGAPTQSFAVDFDANQDGEPEFGLRAQCGEGRIFAVDRVGEIPTSGECGGKVLSIQVQLPRPVSATEVGLRARIEREIAPGQWETVDDLGPGLHPVDVARR